MERPNTAQIKNPAPQRDRIRHAIVSSFSHALQAIAPALPRPPPSHPLGGARPGAGRKPGPSPRNAHRRREPFGRLAVLHVTLRVQRSVASLRSTRVVAEVERSLRAGCERGRFRVVHYALMRDHVHALVEATSASDLSSGMKSFVARLARAVNRALQRRGPVMADRYHTRRVRSPREARHALAYVLLNARRHAAKLGRVPSAASILDAASSARWFDGWRAPITPARDAPAVAAARSWLLAIGWRRHGRIDPAEVPGGQKSLRRHNPA